jgi:pSer/pThr/pTyr-binding forkhead associated (FHA) protein
MPSEYRLIMRTGPTVGKEYPLEKSEIFIGRDLANDITINDPEVSRRHVRIFLQGNQFVLEDLGSTNGTMVNGQRLMGPYVLRSGEMIVLGEQVSLLFEGTEKDVDATIASSGRIPEAQTQTATYREPPKQQPVEPAFEPYAGQVPSQQAYYEEEVEEKRRFPVWLIVVIIILLLLICACVVGIYLIDRNALWCNWFGFIFNAISPGSCP